MEHCFILYSCDGSYEPIISNYTGLTQYVNTFISIVILDPYIVPPTCFYVYYLGLMDCQSTYDIEVNLDVECTCNNFCYFLKLTESLQTTIYVNSQGQLIVENFPTGQTVNFCSRIFPVTEDPDNEVLISDICVGNTCPSSLPTVKRANECDVLTIFPMYVECIIQNPTDDRAFDGSTQLYITGGTPPYTIYWEVGSYAPTLINLGPGQYNATVTDYYGDFSISTTCVLTAGTPTYSGMCFVVDDKVNINYIDAQPLGLKNTKPYYGIFAGLTSIGYVFWDELNGVWVFCATYDCNSNQYYGYLDNNDNDYPISSISEPWSAGTSTSYTMVESYVGPCNPPVEPVIYDDLCIFYLLRNAVPGAGNLTIYVDLTYNGQLNGQPSWMSSNGQYEIYWNTGSTPNQWVATGYNSPYPSSLVFSNVSAQPPLSGWQVYGDASILSFSVFIGPCSATTPVYFTVGVNDALCGNFGSIVINAMGGTPPYQYSINGGVSYINTPLFQNLSAGNYVVQVLDSIGLGSQTLVTVSSGPGSTVYQLAFGVSYSTNTFSVTAPTLPPGVSITFDIVHSSIFQYRPHTLTPVPSYNNIATITGIGPLSLFNTQTLQNAYPGPCNAFYSPYLQNSINNTYYSTITLTSNQTINGTVTDQIINAPNLKCEIATGTYQIQLTNLQMNGCDCCDVVVVGI